MARIGITYQQVEIAAEQLLQEDINPTIDKVRQILGTGSLSTISKHLNEWKSNRLKAIPHSIPSLKTPSDLVNQAVSRVWQQLQEESEAKIADIEASYNEKYQAMLEEQESILNERDRFEEDSQELRSLLKEAKVENAELEKSKIDLLQSNSALQAKLDSLESSYSEFKQLANGSLEKLENSNAKQAECYELQISKLTKEFNEERSQFKDFLENQRHQYIAEVDRLVTDNQKLNKQLEIQTKRFDDICESINVLESAFMEKYSETNEQIKVLEKVSVQNTSETNLVIENVSKKLSDSIRKEIAELGQQSKNNLATILNSGKRNTGKRA